MSKSTYKIIITYILFVGLALLGGCGNKNDDKLVLITTEKNTGDGNQDGTATEAVVNEMSTEEPDTEEEKVTEAASEEDLRITFNQIYNANLGDRLLSDGNRGCSKNTIYYSNGSEVYSEFEFIGFDEDGGYIQAYEDSDGRVQVLDSYNQCWYVAEDNRISTMLYPESGIAAYMINFEHNNMIISTNGDPSNERIDSVYRMDGRLVVEMNKKEDDALIKYQYFMSDDCKIQEIYCYDENGEKISYSWITSNAVYNMPDAITDIMEQSDDFRMIYVEYPYGDGDENIFFVPKKLSVNLNLIQYKAYSDSACQDEWKDSDVESDGRIYLKLN